jgi:hypothetical protein
MISFGAAYYFQPRQTGGRMNLPPANDVRALKQIGIRPKAKPAPVKRAMAQESPEWQCFFIIDRWLSLRTK